MVASTASSDSAALTRSMRPAFSSRYSGNRNGATASRSTITGTAIRNTEPHQNQVSSRPPISGPIAPPAEKLDIQTPMAKVRSFGSGNMLEISDSVDGASVAADRPSRARATISISALVEKAARIEPMPKAKAPIISSLRRPMRSPSVPMVISAPAIMKPYMSTIHRSCVALGLRSAVIAGTARFSTVRSIE